MIFFSLIKKILNYKIVCKLKKKKMNHFLIQLENNLRHVIDLITIMADATNTIQRTYENQQFRIIQVIINLAGEIQMIQNGVQETFFQNLYQTQQDIDANEDFEVSQKVWTDDEIIQDQTNFQNTISASLEDYPIVLVRSVYS